ncbi:hypothetical protein DSO57_1022460 [Entomophthora muscae]|uniref:Uncharacterized protein n=1 Tax=Entomophthora muscae TaxID=34485 RepID=A0ACC2T387_9FUNG|nr:hypothetical protein DSO57_1022460 [Entomophthora muscae]
MKHILFLLAATLAKLDPSYDGEDWSVETTLPRPNIENNPTSRPPDETSRVFEYKPIDSKNPDTPELKILSLEEEEKDTTRLFGKISDALAEKVSSNFSLFKKSIPDTIPEDRIQKIEFYFSEAKHGIRTAQIDAQEQLAAVYSTTKQQWAKIFFGEDAIKQEAVTPGFKEHTYFMFAYEIEKMHDTAAEAVHRNATRFLSKAQQWYMKKLDKKYQATLEKLNKKHQATLEKEKKAQEEEDMKSIYSVVGVGIGF